MSPVLSQSVNGFIWRSPQEIFPRKFPHSSALNRIFIESISLNLVTSILFMLNVCTISCSKQLNLVKTTILRQNLHNNMKAPFHVFHSSMVSPNNTVHQKQHIYRLPNTNPASSSIPKKGYFNNNLFCSGRFQTKREKLRIPGSLITFLQIKVLFRPLYIVSSTSADP